MDGEKYLIGGKAVFPVEILATGGAVVRDIMTADDRDVENGKAGEEDEEFLGERSYFVEQIFDRAPTAKLDATITERQNRIAELSREELQLRTALRTMQEEAPKWTARAAAYETLKGLATVLDCKITHLVIDREYGGVEIVEPSWSDRGRLKMRATFESGKVSMSWYFKDEDYDSTRAIPCTSKEEATALAQRILDAKVEKTRDKADSRLPLCAAKYGLSIDPAYIAAVREREVATLRAEAAELRKKAAAVDARIAAMSTAPA